MSIYLSKVRDRTKRGREREREGERENEVYMIFLFLYSFFLFFFFASYDLEIGLWFNRGISWVYYLCCGEGTCIFV